MERSVPTYEVNQPTAATTETGSSSSSSWWSRAASNVWVWVGGAAALITVGSVALFIVRAARRRAALQQYYAAQARAQQQRGEYDDILRSLRSPEPYNQNAALKQLYEYSRYPKKHDGIRQSGILEILLQILAQHPDNEVLLLHLTRVVANLAINHENRLVLGRPSTVSDLFYLVEHTEDKIKEHLLRCLLNLSLESSIEDVIRETGGLKQLVDMFKSDATSPSVLFQTTRVLLNLVHNANNKAIMTEEGLVAKVVERLVTGVTLENIDFCSRLVNLLGLFAVDCEGSVLAQIATRETAEAFNKLLSLAQNADNVGTVLQATLKIFNRKADHPGELVAFQNAFVEKKEHTDEPSAIQNLIAIFKNATPDSPNIEYARAVLVDLADDENALRAINKVDPSLLRSTAEVNGVADEGTTSPITNSTATENGSSHPDSRPATSE